LSFLQDQKYLYRKKITRQVHGQSKEAIATMSDLVELDQSRKHSRSRRILLLLALISSPLLCCGGSFVLEVLPASLLPASVDFMVNLFEAEATVENRSGEILYITPISTTFGRPMVISQRTSFRLHDIPLRPNRSMMLTYDRADMVLSGIAVCRANNECRLLAVDGSDNYYVDSFENLPELEPDWLLAIQSGLRYNFSPVLIPIMSLVPVVLFLSWLYLGRQGGKRTG
jgi:hypothetical protein